MIKCKKIGCLLLLLICLTSCVTKNDLTKYATVSFEGINHQGMVHTKVNKEKLVLDMFGYPSTKKLSEKEKDKVNQILHSFKIKTSKNNNLSNGDLLTVTVEGKDYTTGYKMTSECEYEVKGLKEDTIKQEEVTQNNKKDDCYTISYGLYDDNKIDIQVPSIDENDNIIVLIHGGYWRSQYTLELMKPMADYFMDKGYTIANIEYRRGNDKWPIPYEDVRNGILKIKEMFKEKNIIIIGHSVGGQLALLNGDLANKVIALAPVTDLIYTKEHSLGNSAVSNYFGETVSQESLKLASPLFNDYNSKKLLIVHGKDDEAVSFENSISYFKKYQSKGNSIDFLAMSNLKHMECIDPTKKHMELIKDWIE